MTCYALTDRSTIRLNGQDTRSFLQGIVTNNVELLASQPAIFTALLSAQGKFQYDFFLINDGDDVLLDVHSEQADSLIRLLTMYRLRADVTLTKQPDMYIYAADKPTGASIHYDAQHPALGQRIISTTQLDALPLHEYHAHRLQCGVPDGYYDAIAGKSLLLELGYDKLHAIDFHKGCYVGQEVTARSKHRGQLRKYLHHVTAPALPEFGTVIQSEGGTLLGDMRSSAGKNGLALIRTEALEKAIAAKETLLAGDTEIHITPLAWLKNNEN